MTYRFPLGPTLSPGSVDRWMDQLLGGFPGDLRSSSSASPNRFVPAVDLWADEQNLFAAVNVPGFTMDQLEVEVHEGVLSLRGKSAPTEAPKAQEGTEKPTLRWFRRERASGEFERRFELPFDVDVDAVEATLDLGVLRIRLPKAARALPRKIVVRSQETRSES